MKKNHLVLLAAIVVIVGTLIVFNRGCMSSRDSEVVKMGVILPLSGKSAIIGEPKKRAFEVALEQFNSPKKRLEIKFEDSQGTATIGTNAFNKLLLDKSIDCYYIDLTPIVNACIPIINSNKVITFAGSAEPEVTNLSNYLFRLFAGGDQEIQMLVDYLHRESVQKVYVLHTNELYGINAFKYFRKMFTDIGGSIVGNDEYPMNNGDFKTQLTKAKASNAERIILLGYGNEYPALLKQALEYDINPDKFVCNLGGSNKSVMELPAKLIQNMTFVGPKFSYLLGIDALEPEMQEFVNLYEKKFSDSPDFRAAYAYDMVTIFLSVYGDGSKTDEQIITELSKIKNYKGASGAISFKENGDTETDLVVAKYKDGTIELLGL